MKAVKENKVYTISEAEKGSYLNRGFDIVLDNGTMEKSRQATVPAEEYDKLKDENEKLKAENKKLKTTK